MSRYKNILFIGSGKIASAIACGLVSSGTVPAEYITVYNRNSLKFEKFQKLGITTSTDLNIASKNSEVIFLAVKPTVVRTVMQELSQINGLLDRVTVVSVAASVPISYIENACNKQIPIIRTMPSTPILIGEGVLSVTRNELVSPRDFEHFCRMMSSISYVAVLPESLMNAIIAVQGSSPAYVYTFVKAILDSAVKQGIDKEIALPLILKTIKGSISMIEQSKDDIQTLIDNVTSPNGTTLAALNSLEHDDFSGSIDRAMIACTKRADEITEEL